MTAPHCAYHVSAAMKRCVLHHRHRTVGPAYQKYDRTFWKCPVDGCHWVQACKTVMTGYAYSDVKNSLRLTA